MRLILLLMVFSLSASVDSDVESLAHQFMSENNVQGMAVAVIYQNLENPDPTVKRTYSFGTLSRRSRVPVNQHTEFRIGPITQTITGALLALMVRDGKADLDVSAAKYLPRSSRLPSYNGRKITLHDLATSTSGLPNIPYDIDKRSSISVSQLYRILSTYELKAAPGSKYTQSNVGYALLSNLLSRIGRGSYPDLLHAKILAPLRMNDTSFTLSPERKKRRATGYEEGRDVPPHIYERLYSVFLGSGGLFSTIDDMSMWLSFNLKVFIGHLGPILSYMQTPSFSESKDVKRALGWEVKKSLNHLIYASGGSLFGYSSHMLFVPEKHCGVVVLSNNGDHSLELLAKKLLVVLQR